MKQVVLNYKGGEVQLVEVPAPVVQGGRLLVRNACSAVSVGTEKLMMDLARKSLLSKARARPDLVRQVIAKARNEGILEAYRAAMGRLDSPVPLGYSCAGRVQAVGDGVSGFQADDPVACFGSGYACHAEVVSVPANLCVPVSPGVSLEEAAFVGPGAIALHAVRLAQADLGSRVAVVGLGLLGLLAVQMLVAAGARVFRVDVDDAKNALARDLGADLAQPPSPDTADHIRAWSGGPGADAVLIFAASESSAPLDLAMQAARERAWLVVPGMVDLKLDRRPLYEKELRLVVSRSAGPGIYDPTYEEKGQDYPLSHVRWTAQRNMAEFVDLLARGRVRVTPLITHRYPIEDALAAYATVSSEADHRIGVVLTYPQDGSHAPGPVEVRPEARATTPRQSASLSPPKGTVGIGLVGAGLFARTTLLPILKGMDGFSLRGVASATGLSARHVAHRYGFGYATSRYEDLLEDPDVDAVIIATRHHLHAPMAAAALEAGKAVLLEKPLATTPEGLEQVARAHAKAKGPLLVGFNRRYSPLARQARQAMQERNGPAAMQIRVNAGPVPPGSWVVDPVEGGGRVIGEVCHFIDLALYLSGALPVKVYAHPTQAPGAPTPDDSVAVILDLADGSVATILYATTGDRAFPRERVEVFWDGSACAIDNFKSLELVRHGKRQRTRRWSLDRGHRAELEAFLRLVRGEEEPVPFQQYAATTQATFVIMESLRLGAPVPVESTGTGGGL